MSGEWARAGVLCSVVWLAAAPAEAEPVVRFRPVQVVIHTGEAELAAYQVELVVRDGEAQIVGVEGGEHPAFVKPPYYDPRALMGGRVILAAFSTAPSLPRGAVRVATVHLREASAAVSYAILVQAAAGAAGQRLPVKVSLVTPES